MGVSEAGRVGYLCTWDALQTGTVNGCLVVTSPTLKSPGEIQIRLAPESTLYEYSVTELLLIPIFHNNQADRCRRRQKIDWVKRWKCVSIALDDAPSISQPENVFLRSIPSTYP